LVREGLRINVKRVYRLWRQEGLMHRERKRKRRRKEKGSVPLRAEYPHHVWTYDFLQDATVEGGTLRILTLTDEYTRESLRIEVARRMPARAVIEMLQKVFQTVGKPEYLRSDNGPEFIAKAIRGWLTQEKVRPHYIDPGSPWQNAYAESFHDKLRDECLNMEVFTSLAEAKVIVERWRQYYNTERPHSSLAYQTPSEYKAAWRDQSGATVTDRPEFIALRATRRAGTEQAGPEALPVACTAGRHGARVALQRSPILRAGKDQYISFNKIEKNDKKPGILTF